MTTIVDFEELDAWQRARALTSEIYAATSLPPLRADFYVADQMKRASVSIMSNIAEGFDRGGVKEFVHFLSIAKASAAECRSLLYVGLDAGYIDDESFERMRSLSKECTLLIGGLMNYLRRSSMRGAKFNR